MEKMVFGKDGKKLPVKECCLVYRASDLIGKEKPNVQIEEQPRFVKAVICKPAEDAVLGGTSDDDWAELADDEEWDTVDYDVEGEVPDEGFEDDGYWPDEDPDEYDESHDMH